MRGGVVAVVAGLTLLGGCARDATGPADIQVEGVYHLATVNGASLPFLIQQDSASRVDVTESVLTLNHDKTWSEVVLYRVVEYGQTTTPSQMSIGTYTTLNGAVELTDSNGASAHGAVSGNFLTLLDRGFGLVYRR